MEGRGRPSQCRLYHLMETSLYCQCAKSKEPYWHLPVPFGRRGIPDFPYRLINFRKSLLLINFTDFSTILLKIAQSQKCFHFGSNLKNNGVKSLS